MPRPRSRIFAESRCSLARLGGKNIAQAISENGFNKWSAVIHFRAPLV
jgi:hypothetical protein